MVSFIITIGKVAGPRFSCWVCHILQICIETSETWSGGLLSMCHTFTFSSEGSKGEDDLIWAKCNQKLLQKCLLIRSLLCWVEFEQSSSNWTIQIYPGAAARFADLYLGSSPLSSGAPKFLGHPETKEWSKEGPGTSRFLGHPKTKNQFKEQWIALKLWKLGWSTRGCRYCWRRRRCRVCWRNQCWAARPLVQEKSCFCGLLIVGDWSVSDQLINFEWSWS